VDEHFDFVAEWMRAREASTDKRILCSSKPSLASERDEGFRAVGEISTQVFRPHRTWEGESQRFEAFADPDFAAHVWYRVVVFDPVPLRPIPSSLPPHTAS
jgi:hypothetical protein